MTERGHSNVIFVMLVFLNTNDTVISCLWESILTDEKFDEQQGGSSLSKKPSHVCWKTF